jgi:hypothetical protein
LIRNPDVDSPQFGSASAPSFWHRSANATWTDDVALSPTHSLELRDTSATGAEEWRSYATAIQEGENRTLDLRWFWKYAIDAGSEFRARLRFSNDPVTGVGLTNPTSELNFSISGSNSGFEMFEASLAVADMIRSFDLTFITAGNLNATGLMYIDDITAALAAAPLLAGDYNQDGTVDAADYVVWRKTDGSQGGYNTWRANFGRTAGSAVSASAHAAPEPATFAIVATGLAFLRLPRRRAHRPKLSAN